MTFDVCKIIFKSIEQTGSIIEYVLVDSLKKLIYDLSVGSTETKYIKLKTKTQNNIVISGIFHKKSYCYFGFF